MRLRPLRLFQYSLLCLLLFFEVSLIYGHHYYNAPGPLPQPKTVYFKKGTGFLAIVDQLAQEGVIRHPLVFKAVAAVAGDARRFKAGEYHFTSAISPKLVMDMIAEGRVVVHRLLIPEGLTVAEIMALLNKEDALEGEIAGTFEEGSLLPETFHFVRGDSRQEMVRRMYVGMKSLMAQLWPKRKEGLPFSSEQEALTLASVVERETDLDAERSRVAAVYINRLRKGMKLQADPTVIYGIVKDKGAPLGRALLLSDLKYDSPYNTYLNAGLPPGPIANPGRKSIEAALKPAETNELYFVATGTGGHRFAATAEQHNKNVKEYRAMQKQKKEQQAAPAN